MNRLKSFGYTLSVCGLSPSILGPCAEELTRQAIRRDIHTNRQTEQSREMLLAKDQAYVCPGDRLGEVEQANAGTGTYVWQDKFILAGSLGRLQVIYPSLAESKTKSDSQGKPTLTIMIEDSKGQSGSHQPGDGSGSVASGKKQQTRGLALEIGDEVLAKVKRLNPRYASVDIICKGTSPLVREFSGIIRVQDVRASEIDKVRRPSKMKNSSRSVPITQQNKTKQNKTKQREGKGS